MKSIDNLKLSKRDFLKYSTSLLTASILPFSAQLVLANEDWDLIVIGGGTAGLPAAIFSANRGLKVLIIEKAPSLGGTLFLSTGQIAGSGTIFQKNKGIQDTPDEHYEDIMRINKNSSDPDLTRILVNNAGNMINWLAANGYRIFENHPVTGIGHEHFKIARYQQGLMGGISILNVFKPFIDQGVKQGNITVLLNTGAADLIQDEEGSIVGVVAENIDGKQIEYKARNTVIASGGCASNPHLFEELHNIPLYCQIAYPFSQGTGLLLGQSAGGFIHGGDKYASLVGMIPADDKYPSTMYGRAPLNPSIRRPWEILVNSNGRRFVQEDNESIDHIEHGILQQPGQRHWAIFDQRILEESPPMIPDWNAQRIINESKKHPMFKNENTLSKLAIKSGINPNELSQTIDKYNAGIKNSTPDEFNRSYRPVSIEKPPFYSIRMQGWTLVSFAGLAVNKNLQVIKSSGEPIQNLFAVGEVIGAGATSGNAYVNGMLVTPAITFGRLLGENIGLSRQG